ncbi:RidA family protein [Alkalihalophilus pseudofirmus]|uniref:RidA family protein n=1 Tax=Alkalihalophilus pseudofirmus TaxID=79885 RepID=A0AAJ2KZ40_ALKPS|nr:RidA family protein [Alkalihalophilus pseudofirmus]MDV2883709.1 RidA family protein [Alkalihalophilus pseudofirmus]
MSYEEKLNQLKINLPTAFTPKGVSLLSVKQAGNILYTSGHDCRVGDELLYQGKVGSDLTIEEGREAAKQTVINCLGSIKSHLGSLNHVVQIIKMTGYINCQSDFDQLPHILDSASDILISIFGVERGGHARSAIGVESLPYRIPIEIELVVEVKTRGGKSFN